MRSSSYAVGVLVSVVTVAVAATGCSTTTGTPVAETAIGATTSPTTTSPTTTSPTTTSPRSPARTTSPTTTPAPAQPTGDPVGTAVMSVIGGSGPVDIRYRLNDGPEQTETNVTLPWEMQYDVYDRLTSEITADGGDTLLTCTIIMEPDLLVSFESEPRPTCSFAYYD